MPSLRITIASNAQRNTKSIVLIPVTDADAFDTVISLAAKKLRIKGKRIFREGGLELERGQVLLKDLQNDDLLLISASEDYVGSITAVSADEPIPGLQTDLAPPIVRVLANHAEVDTQARSQLSGTASRLQGIIAAIGMPDLHPGSSAGFPVGATIVSHKSVIYPPLIGGDIGCGMALYRTNVAAPAEGHAGLSAARKLAEKIRGIEGPYGEGLISSDSVYGRTWLDDAGVNAASLEHPSFTANINSLGTIGGGNHFAELQAVHAIRDPELFAQYIPNFQSSSSPPLFLLVHSGSRGVGQDILASTRSETQKGARPLVVGTSEFKSYIALHDDACRWARCNRDLIGHRILSRIDSSYSPSSTPLQHEIDATSSAISSSSHISTSIKSRKLIDIWHNNVEKRPWGDGSDAPTSSSTADPNIPAPEEVWLHRKGAAPSDKGLIVIPGSRGAFSYLVLPTGPQRDNAYSVAHGAGRSLARTKARSKALSSPNVVQLARSLETTSTFQSVVICEERDLLFEEVPEAYKQIENVVRDLEESGIVKVVAVMRPVVTYKTRKEGRHEE